MKFVTFLCTSLLLSAPSFGQITKFQSPSTNLSDQFGGSVAVHGDIVLVGAQHASGWAGGSSGAAYFFDLTSGLQTVDLKPCNGASSDHFGYPVAIRGTRAIVGAISADGVGGNSSGKAYIFEVPSGACLFSLEPSDSAPMDQFGRALAINDNYAVIGVPNNDSNGQGAGAAYVFDVTTGQELHRLFPADGVPFIGFGSSVAIHGNLIAVGAGNGHGVSNYTGAVYLFDAVTGAERLKLMAPDGQVADRFGNTLAMNGTRLVVGAPFDRDNGNGAGSTYLFDPLTNTLVKKILAPDGAAGEFFGSALTMDGNYIAVGAYGDEGVRGSSYLFDAATGDYVTKHQAGDGQAADAFGVSLGIDGDNLLVGATGDDDQGLNAGAVYIFRVTGPTEHTGKPFCLGDGSGTACPCGTSAGPGAGCLNGSGVGATLTASGNASVIFDSFQVAITGVPSGNLGILLQGNKGVNLGLGIPVGDGLLCTSGNSVRSQVEMETGGLVTFSNFQGQPFGDFSYQSGATTNYQCWYRDVPGTCSGSGFNFSNAWAVKWLP